MTNDNREDPTFIDQSTYENISTARRVMQVDKLGSKIDIFNTFPVTSRSFYFDVALGKIPGASSIRIFGENPSIDSGTPADLWDAGDTSGAEIYTFSPGTPGIGGGATANIDTISSSNAGDTQDILITGLDINGDLTEQIATLDGQNKVTLGTSLWRMFSAVNIGSVDIAGDVYIYVDGDITAGVPDTVTDIRAKIVNGNNITQMSVFTVPRNSIAMFTNIEYSIIKRTAATAEISPLFRFPGEVFVKAVTATVYSTGTAFAQELSPVPEKFPEFADMLLRASTSGIDVTIGGSYTLIILDKTIWNLT